MPQGQVPNSMINFVPLLFLFAIFYFMLIRPQRKQEKERLAMLGKLSKNDEVVTSGGIHGTIVNVKEKTVIVRVDENTRLEIDRGSITQVVKSAPAGGVEK